MNTVTRIIQLAAVAAALLLASCGGTTRDSAVLEDVEPLACVALLPTAAPYSEENQGVQDRESLREGAQYLYRQLKEELEKTTVPQIVEAAELKEQLDEVSGGTLGVVKEIGRRARCGAVLLSTLSRYRQRQGGEYAVDEPASASFELRLIEAHSGRGLWTASFSETQTSLMSNLFSFGKAQSRGFKWITVEELVAQGVAEKISECPYFQ